MNENGLTVEEFFGHYVEYRSANSARQLQAVAVGCRDGGDRTFARLCASRNVNCMQLDGDLSPLTCGPDGDVTMPAIEDHTVDVIACEVPHDRLCRGAVDLLIFATQALRPGGIVYLRSMPSTAVDGTFHSRWGELRNLIHHAGLSIVEFHRSVDETEIMVVASYGEQPSVIEELQGGPRRHLLYHVYPRRESVWRWNVQKMKKRLSLFNGRKVVHVALDDTTDSLEAVQKEFDDATIHYETSPNSYNGETTPLIATLLPAVETEPGVTFYAHAKGVSYEQEDRRLPYVRAWVNNMYDFNLRPDAVRYLEIYETVGIYRKRMFLLGSTWHYSGNFFWFRNSALFSRSWQHVYGKRRRGAEAYIGLHTPLEQSYCLYGELGKINLYEQFY